MSRILVGMLTCLLSGCALLDAPKGSAKGSTVPVGDYDTPAEKWADESLTARRKAAKEKTEKELRKMDQK